MTKHAITVEFDLDRLTGYTDEHLATLWHVAQANPAPTGDAWAGDIASHIGFEIIRRWLANTPAELHNHQQKDHYWEALRRFARYVPPAGVDQFDPDWMRGEWVQKTEESNQ